MSSTGGISAITDRALAQVAATPAPAHEQSGGTPAVADAPAPGMGAPTAYDSGAAIGAAPLEMSAAAAAAATSAPAPAATSLDTSAPVEWTGELRAAFTGLGLQPGQVAFLESQQLDVQTLSSLADALTQDPSAAAAIPGGSDQGSAPTAGAAVPRGAGRLGASSGNGAWNDEWRRKFLDLGVPPDVIAQLTVTGGAGMGERDIQAAYTQIKKTIEQEIDTFREQHPEEYDKLKGMPRGDLLQIASAVNSGQVGPDELEKQVEMAAMSGGPGKMIGDMVIKGMLPWAVIPGWGLIRTAGMVTHGGKDPISGMPMHLDFWNHEGQDALWGAMDLAMAAGGALSLATYGRGVSQALKGIKIANGTAHGATITAAQGVNFASSGAAGTWSTVKAALLPMTRESKVATGLARLNGDTVSRVARMADDTHGAGEAGKMAQLALDKMMTGEVGLHSTLGVKASLMGVVSDSRGIVMNRNKPLFDIVSQGGKTIVRLDSSVRGEALPAVLASIGTRLQDTRSVQSKIATIKEAEAAGTALVKPANEILQTEALGRAAQWLQQNGMLREPQGLRKFAQLVRPNATTDALRAITSLDGAVPGNLELAATKALTQQHRWVKPAVFGGAALAAGGGGYWMMNAQKAPTEGGHAGPEQSQRAAEREQFLALPPQQQAAYIAEQAQMLQASVEQAGGEDRLTPQQQRQLQVRIGELEELQAAAQQTAVQPGA